MNESVVLQKYLQLFEPMNVQFKLDLIAGLSRSVKEQLPPTSSIDKQVLFNELRGAWRDMEDDIEEVIVSSRTISDKEIQLD